MNIGTAQSRWGFEGTIGLREDFNQVIIVSGNVIENKSAYPVFKANVNYFLSKKLFINSGFQVNNFSLRTVADGFDFNAMLQRHYIFGINSGINRVFRPDKRLNIEVGLGSNFLFPLVSNSVVVNANTLPDPGQPTPNVFYKSEQASFIGQVAFIPYVKAGVNFQLRSTVSLVFGYQYNIGTRTFLERTVNYSLSGTDGEAIYSTDGSSIQFNSGVRFRIAEKN